MSSESSSAKMSTVVGCDTASGRSFISIRNRSGERTDPCGTPCVRVWGEDYALRITVRCVRFCRNERIRSRLLIIIIIIITLFKCRMCLALLC